jgi:hypothetical protein
MIRLAASQLVVQHDLPLISELLERLQVVMWRTRPAMEDQQRKATTVGAADDAIPESVVTNTEQAFPRGHASTLVRWC